MSLYWSTRSIPELAELSSAERRRVLTAVGRKPFRLWHYWAALVGAFVVLMLFYTLALPLLEERGSPRVLRMLVVLAVITLVIVVLRHLSFYLTRPFIREFLERERDVGGSVNDREHR